MLLKQKAAHVLELSGLLLALVVTALPARAGNIYFQTTGSAPGHLIATVSHNDPSRGVGEPHLRRLVRDAAGLWYAVWMDLDGSDGAGSTGFYEIRMSKSLDTAGTSWSASVELAGDTGIIYTDAVHGFYHPTIDIDRASGALHLVLQRLTGPPPDLETYDDHIIYSKCTDLLNCDVAGSWYQLDGVTNGYSTPVTNSSCHEPHAGYAPSLAVDSGGNAHILYTTGLQKWPWYIHGSVGSGWAAPIQMDTTNRNHRFPTIELDSTDVVHVAWNQLQTFGTAFYRHVYHRSAPGPAYTAFSGATQLVFDAGDVHLDWVSMAADDEGNVHLACAKRSTSELAGAYFDGATWTPHNPLSGAGWDRPQVSAHLGAAVTDDVILTGTSGADPDDLYTFNWNGASWGAVPTDVSAAADTALSIEKRAPAGSAEYGFIYFDVVGTANHRSIGTAPDYTTGSVTATAGSAIVTGTGTAWRSANRGRGDRITINGVDYVVINVLSETSLALTAPASATYSGTSYTIARQFATLTEWEDCVDGPGGTPCPYFPVANNNLVTDDRSEIGIAYKDTVFTDNLVIDGSDTDSSHTITLTVDPGNRHFGTAGTGVVLNPGASGHAITVMDNNVRVEWLEITDWFGDSAEGVRVQGIDTFFDYMIVHDGFDTDGQDEADGFNVQGNTGGNWSTTIRNTIVYNTGRAGIHVQNLFGTFTLVANIENVTLFNNGTITGFVSEETGGISTCETATNDVVINARNVLSVGNRDRDGDGDGDFNERNTGCVPIDWGTSDFNISSDNTAKGTTVWTGVNAVDQFVSIVAGEEDLHLKPGAAALNAGTALSAATDIDNDSRPHASVWDIGADEAVPSGTCPPHTVAWFDTQWMYRKAIALNSTLVAGPLTDFPALVVLDNDAQLMTSARADFNDIVFTAADGVTKLPHEIEAYDSAQGDLTAWVKVPYMSLGSDTIIYIYYGNADPTDHRDPENVWDANYVGVWHLSEVGAASLNEFIDSTANNNDAQGGAGVLADVPAQVDAKIGKGQDFDNHCPGPTYTSCSTIHIELPNTPTLENVQESNYTLEAWFRAETVPPNIVPDNDLLYAVVMKRGLHSGLGFESGNWSLHHWLTGDVIQWTGTPGAATGSYYHMVGTVDVATGGGTLYINGAPSATSWGAAATREYGAEPWRIGMAGFNTNNWLWGADGQIDEVRISSTVRSAEWAETSFQNQDDPAAFCHVCAQTTEVSLESFEASGYENEVRLEWKTASELNNLGFHVYRATAEGGPYERLSERMIPGLVSSAVGAHYRYNDSGLTNGTTYYYELEDIESTGKTARHGPVHATPLLGVQPERSEEEIAEEEEGEESTSARITYGEPSENTFEILRRSARGLTLRLHTAGFYAEPLKDGTVRIAIPGLEELNSESSLPVKRSWLDAVPGLKVKLAAVDARQVESIDGLVPAGSAVDEMVASSNGTVRRRRRRARRVFGGDGLEPAESARVVSVGFQGDAKKALVEMAPLRWDASSGRLLLARDLEVRIVFRGRDPDEGWSGTGRFRGGRTVMARLVTHERGLYGARFEDVVAHSRHRRAFPTSSLRLSRQGEAVAYHVEPDPHRFGPGSTLYFLGDGASVNPYGTEAVYELESGEGERMAVFSALPSGALAPFYWRELSREENRLYQAGLVHAPDIWLWDLVMARETKSYRFVLGDIAPVGEMSHVTVWLQGTSDGPAPTDHRVRAYVNGTLVGESSWDGKRAVALEAELATAILSPGDNVLELENVGDTGSSFSVVMLDRFSLRYPAPLTFEGSEASTGSIQGLWSVSGVSEIPESFVLDVTSRHPRWLGKTSRFRADAMHRYLAVSPDAVLRPDVVRPRATGLKSKRNQADYVVVGSREFLHAAEPLLAHRRARGLRVVGVPTEELFSEFGFGETNPQAIQDFLAYAYHEWRKPSPRYVLLLGDGSFDYKDYLQTGAVNHVPPRMVKTTYLWTASDPSYAAVNGDDVLPDLAIGRLPASDANELRVMVEKILAYETGAASLDAPVVFVADNPDAAGHFEGDADELAATVLAGRDVRRIYLSQLGTPVTRGEIVDAFDEGASLMSYIGHGAIHLWADENLFDIGKVSSLAPQSQQPLLLTMNCLNGYFHFPYFDSLAEGLVKADGKGAIAAFSPSGLSLNAPAKRYHEALLREILSSRHERLGDAVLEAQMHYAETGAFPELLSIYHLFGDPALKIRPSTKK